MGPSTTACVLAAVVVLILIMVAAVVLCCRPGSRGKTGFMPGDAATPKLREAVALLGKDLDCITRVADSVDGRGEKIEASFGAADMGPAFDEARLALAGARQGMGEIVHSVRRLKSTVDSMTPTYQNVLGLYRGLRDSDKALWETAKALDLAGDRLQALAEELGESPAARELWAAGAQLRQVSSCLYGLVRSIHYLGSALLLE